MWGRVGTALAPFWLWLLRQVSPETGRHSREPSGAHHQGPEGTPGMVLGKCPGLAQSGKAAGSGVWLSALSSLVAKAEQGAVCAEFSSW